MGRLPPCVLKQNSLAIRCTLSLGLDLLLWLVAASILHRPKSEAADDGSRVQQLAWQVAETRILLRHRHADARSNARRAEIDRALACEPTGDMYLDVGDFNTLPISTRGAVSISPDVPTFRRDAKTNHFVTCIDGAKVSAMFAVGAGPLALDAVPGVQNKPVLMDFR